MLFELAESKRLLFEVILGLSTMSSEVKMIID
jgi:hypothetical protein